MHSGGSHLPLGNLNLKGKLYGDYWSCGCCGRNFNKKKYLVNKKPSRSNLVKEVYND